MPRTLFVYIMCQSINVSAKSRLVGEQASEPADMPAYKAHHSTYKEHGKQGAGADNVPLPLAKEPVACHYSESHERDVGHYLHLGKLHARDLTHGNGKSFAWHGHAAAAHLKGIQKRESKPQITDFSLIMGTS